LKHSGYVNHAIWRKNPEDQNPQHRADVEYTTEVGENGVQ